MYFRIKDHFLCISNCRFRNMLICCEILNYSIGEASVGEASVGVEQRGRVVARASSVKKRSILHWFLSDNKRS